MDRHEALSQKYYDEVADGYDRSFEGEFTRRFQKELLACVMEYPGEKVLDVACGNGTFLKTLCQKRRIDGYGADLSARMIDNAKRINPSMHLAQAPCDHIPFDDASFDLVTVCCAFHHFPKPKAFAKEVFRLLAPHGMLCIAEVYYPTFARFLFNPFLPLLKAGDVKFYGPGQITRILEAEGFEKKRFQRNGDVQILAFQKP